MSVLDIYLFPHPILRKKAKEVTEFDRELHKFLDDMGETMFVADGVGLAAPQVGVSKRIFVLSSKIGELLEGEVEGDVIEMINPEITEYLGEEVTNDEGCLSFPDVYGPVKRWSRVRVQYRDRYGNQRYLDATALMAIAVQHELDHLNGVLLIDKFSSFRQRQVKKWMKKLFGDTELHLQPFEIKRRLGKE